MATSSIPNGDNMTVPPLAPSTMEFRWEHDLIGDERVPKHAYYGIQTQRA